MLVRLDQRALKAVAAESVTKLHPKMHARCREPEANRKHRIDTPARSAYPRRPEGLAVATNPSCVL